MSGRRIPGIRIPGTERPKLAPFAALFHVGGPVTNKLRKTLVVCGCAVTLSAIVAVVAIRASHRPRLPALGRHEGLPQAFDEALRHAREQADLGGDPEAVRHLALLYQANRLYDEAKACFRVIASGASGLTAQDHYCLANIALEESDMDGGKSELDTVIGMEPDYVPAQVALAEVLLKTGKEEDASRQYEAVLRADRDNPQASFGLARLELQRGDDSGAIARLRRVVALYPNASSSVALLAQIMDRKGQTEQANDLRQLSKQAHDPVPSDPWLRPLLADCYDIQRLGIAFEQFRLSGQLDEAMPLLDRLEQLEPESWMPHMLRGWSLKEARNFAGAVGQYRKALNSGGDPETICPLLGNALIQDGKLPEAAALLADYHRRMPHSIPILKSYGEVAVRLGDTPLARSLLTEVLADDPYLYMQNMSLVQILWNAGEHDEAVKYLRRVAAVFLADVDSRGLLGQYYLEKADPNSAIGPLEEAMAILGGTGDKKKERIERVLDKAYLLAGSLEAAKGRLSQALAFSEKAIALMPSEPRGVALKVNVCKGMGDFKGAAGALERWIALGPAQAGTLMDLGDLEYQGGEPDRAKEHWRQALQLASADATELRSALDMRLSGRITPELFK